MGRGAAAKATAGLVNRQRFLTSPPLLPRHEGKKRFELSRSFPLELARPFPWVQLEGSSRFLPDRSVLSGLYPTGAV
uniref:Uncharacterized protein n=1 Tax=Oryza rufipogon TaxID=4529 RepID=A0A0E0Q7K4_ORYRU